MKHIRTNLLGVAALVFALVGLLAVPAGAVQTVTTPNGEWRAYPGQSTTYQTSVQPPINPDGSSNYKASSKAVIPVKLSLAQGTGAFLFRSIFSDNPGVTSNDYSYLTWVPAIETFTLADVTRLIADYAFTDGDCAGGSLRWTVYLDDAGTTRNLDIHYQPGADGISQQICATGTDGADMTDSSDTIVVIQEFTHAPYTFSSAYNVTYTEAVTQLGTLPVLGMSLIVDSGWGANGDQVIDLTSATVGFGGPNGYIETFTPQPASSMTPTCPTEEAEVRVDKTDGSSTGAVNEATSIQPADDDGVFRIVDCKYMYNLATTSLRGVGTYKVYAVIDGVQATGPATFDLK